MSEDAHEGGYPCLDDRGYVGLTIQAWMPVCTGIIGQSSRHYPQYSRPIMDSPFTMALWQ